MAQKERHAPREKAQFFITFLHVGSIPRMDFALGTYEKLQVAIDIRRSAVGRIYRQILPLVAASKGKATMILLIGRDPKTARALVRYRIAAAQSQTGDPTLNSTIAWARLKRINLETGEDEVATMVYEDVVVLTDRDGNAQSFPVMKEVEARRSKGNFKALLAALERVFPNARNGVTIKLEVFQRMTFTTPLESAGSPSIRPHPLGTELWAVRAKGAWYLAVQLKRMNKVRKPPRKRS